MVSKHRDDQENEWEGLSVACSRLDDLEPGFPDQRFYPFVDVLELVWSDVLPDEGNDWLPCSHCVLQ